MTKMRLTVLGFGFAAASCIPAVNAAYAMNAPTAIEIDGGPLDTLELSGGVDGYGFTLPGLGDHQTNTGMNVGSAIIQLQKTSGELQFNLQLGSTGGVL